MQQSAEQVSAWDWCRKQHLYLFYENTDWEIHYLADSKLTRFLNALINRLICNIQTILLAVDPLLNVRN